MPGVTRVGYFGPSGTFTEEALLTQPDLAAGERVPLASVPDVIAAVERGEVDVGVVPIENSIEGSVSVTLDTLAFDSDLLIQREVDLPISLNLCARPGIDARRRHDGRCRSRTRSAQCRGLARQEAARASQVVAATRPPRRPARSPSRSGRAWPRSATRSRPSSTASRCSRREIEDHPENQTRFVLVGRGHPRADRPRQDDRSSASSARTGRARCSRSSRSSRPARSTSRSSSRGRPSGASATTASSSTSRATSPTSSSPTACATSRRSRPR